VISVSVRQNQVLNSSDSRVDESLIQHFVGLGVDNYTTVAVSENGGVAMSYVKDYSFDVARSDRQELRICLNRCHDVPHSGGETGAGRSSWKNRSDSWSA
jgi:hypothetical protein